MASVALMLDGEATGTARVLAVGEPVPYGALPVLVADTTVYGAVRVEEMLRSWHTGLPRPWLVWLADVPAAPPVAARYRIRALRNRLAGLAQVSYLPSLRTVERPEEALAHKDVTKAALKLRRQLEGN
ncbi:hypothetical protein [Streptomyces sp. NPDC058475]|uniref:hypothetical protein n=1 Tax=unclassified Streptomyces TaxID=2593676 RepID=UPI003650C585